MGYYYGSQYNSAPRPLAEGAERREYVKLRHGVRVQPIQSADGLGYGPGTVQRIDRRKRTDGYTVKVLMDDGSTSQDGPVELTFRPDELEVIS